MEARARVARRKASRTSTWPIAVAAFLSLGGAAWAVVPTRCVSLDVPAPFVLPDGTAHAASPMKLCLDQNLNPVTGLHRVYVDGMPAGFLTSRVSNPEAPASAEPLVLFQNDAGRLRLVGYTVAFDGRIFSYRLRNSRAGHGTRWVTAQDDGSCGPPSDGTTDTLLVARSE